MYSLIALVVAALVSSSVADVVDGPCVSENGTKYAPGDSWKESNPCQEYKCIQVGLAPMIEITKCPTYTVKDPCYLKYYPYKAFPDCCPTPDCPSNSQPYPYVWNAHGHGK